MLVLNSNGQVILGGDIGKQAPERLASAVEAEKSVSGYVRETWINDEPGLTGYARSEGFRDFKGLGWRVMVHQPLSSIMAPVREIQLRMAVTGLAIAAVFFGLASLLIRRLVRPLDELNQSLNHATSMDDLERLEAPGAYGELWEMVHRLSALARRIRESEDQLDRERATGRRQASEIRDLKRTATTDALTGALNRHGLQANISAVLAESAGATVPMGFIVLDLDHFKRVNDTYGHAAGDQVLKIISREIMRSMRTTDIFARSGGEEFVIVAPGARPVQTLRLARRLRTAVSEARIPVDSREIQVTASLGVSHAHVSSRRDIDALMKRADGLAYNAKRAGRNRVETDIQSGITPKQRQHSEEIDR